MSRSAYEARPVGSAVIPYQPTTSKSDRYAIHPISRALALAVVQASFLNSSRVKIASGSSALNSVHMSPHGASLFRHVILRQVPRTEIEISFLCTSTISSWAIPLPRASNFPMTYPVGPGPINARVQYFRHKSSLSRTLQDWLPASNLFFVRWREVSWPSQPH
jgi:hypothetical protein